MRKIFALILSNVFVALYLNAAGSPPPSGGSVTASYIPLTCNGNTTTITAVASGFTGTVQYSFNGGSTFSSANTFIGGVGTYTIVATNGASTASTILMVAPNSQNYTVSATVNNVLCNGNSTGSIVATITNPTFNIDGIMNEVGWGSAAATNAGGPGYGFGPGHELNAAYINSTATDLFLGIAGDVQNNNRIIIFIDSKPGGYNNGSFGRSGAPQGVDDFNSGTTFDPGFFADYALCIGTNGLHNNFFFDLFPLTASGGGNVYLGDNFSPDLHGAPAASGSQTNGFEMKIPWSSLGGLPVGNFKIFAMYSSDGGFLSNQFLQRAGPFEGNYTNGAVTFGAATPDPITKPSFSFTWSNGATTLNNTNLAAGTYTLTVSNSAGCTSTTTYTISQPAPIVVSSAVTHASCFNTNGSVTITASGGVGTITGTGTFPQASSIFTYTVTDANNCSATTAVTVTEPNQFLISITSTPINCNGDQSTVTVTGTGGTLPYGSGVGTFTYPAGTFTISAQDANGCVDASVITLTQPALALNATATAPPILCFGNTTTITVAATGGTTPYTGTGSFSSNAGTYSYTVTDANGCSSVSVINLTQPNAYFINLTELTPALCSNGLAVVEIASFDGVPPYTPANGSTINLAPGTHTVTAVDANGCSATSTIQISAPSALVVNAVATAPITCNGGTTSINVSASGGTAPYNGIGTFSNISANTYTYTVIDGNNCTATTSVTITEPIPVTVSISANQNPISSGSVLSLTALGNASSALSYSWQLPSGGTASGSVYTVNASAGSSGVYTVTASTGPSCSATSTISISVLSHIRVSPRVVLGGPFNTSTGLMSDSLRQKGLIPLTDPYSTATYSSRFVRVPSGGNEVTTFGVLSVSTPADAIVDWVWLELRNTPTNIVESRAALLQRDGDIVDEDGVSPVEFVHAGPGNYYVVVSHRNHLGVMSASPVALGTNTTVVDFKSTGGLPLYTLPAATNTPTRAVAGIRNLYAGNCSISGGEAALLSYGSWSTSDRSRMQSVLGSSTVNGYSIFDCDLNGFARYSGLQPDRLVILTNVGNNTSTVIKQQIP